MVYPAFGIISNDNFIIDISSSTSTDTSIQNAMASWQQLKQGTTITTTKSGSTLFPTKTFVKASSASQGKERITIEPLSIHSCSDNSTLKLTIFLIYKHFQSRHLVIMSVTQNQTKILYLRATILLMLIKYAASYMRLQFWIDWSKSTKRLIANCLQEFMVLGICLLFDFDKFLLN